MPIPRDTRPLLERMEKFIDRSTSATGCWLWTGATTRGGYGNYAIHRVAHRVPRIMLSEYLGLDLRGPWIARHTCDNPPCCNPDHLVAGTQKQNVDDMINRGRGARGESYSKLKEAQVLEIRDRASSGESSRSIMVDYPVSYEQIRRVVTRKTWSWLT